MTDGWGRHMGKGKYVRVKVKGVFSSLRIFDLDDTK